MRVDVGLVCGAVVLAGAGSLAPFLLRLRRSPKEKERRRRELVSGRGRVIEGFVFGCSDGVVEYSYQWRGVRYEATQSITDVDGAEALLSDFAGPVTVKFLTNAPANSIVISETWNGIPVVRRRTAS